MNADHVEQQRYDGISRTMHWTIALLVATNLATGLLHEPLENVVRLMPLHKSVGATILVLSFLRLGWRLGRSRPPFPPEMNRYETAWVSALQVTFYGLLVVMPLTGWIIASAGKFPFAWFGLVTLPKLDIEKGGALYGFGHEAHGVLGWLFAGLIILHVAGALWHHFRLQDPVLRRML